MLFPKTAPDCVRAYGGGWTSWLSCCSAAVAGGHHRGLTDDLGSAQHGLVLSRRRAAAVARVLRPQLDKSDYPFSVSGRGEADPAVPNTSEKNRKLNRRVELTYRPSG